MGFGVPVGRWFRGELKDFMRETLLSRSSINRGYFRPDFLKGLVEDHINGKRDLSFQLWALLNLELWHKGQPAGQRLQEKLEWCKDFLLKYGYAVTDPRGIIWEVTNPEVIA